MGSDSALAGHYVLDSFALLAHLQGERRGDHVKGLLLAARDGRCALLMSVVNLGEVLYIVERRRGAPAVRDTLGRVQRLPVEFVDADRGLTLAAAHLKAQFPIAYADCFAAALALLRSALLVTGDPEFRKFGPDSGVSVEWLS